MSWSLKEIVLTTCDFVGIGNNAEHSELLQIATKPDNMFHVLDVKSLSAIRRQIEKRLCLGKSMV